MSKRFTNTEIWEEDWFLELDSEQQLFWFYLKDACNHAGLWKVNRKQFEYVLGKKFDLEKFLAAINAGKSRVLVFGDRWFIISFIRFQYGEVLNENNRVHLSIIKQLKDYISDKSVLDLILTSNRPQNDPNYGVKDKDKDKDRERKGGVGERKGKTAELDVDRYGKFADVVERWMRYKAGRNQPYGTQDSLDEFQKSLNEMSGGNPVAAGQIVAKSMAQNWSGIFPVGEAKSEQNGNVAFKQGGVTFTPRVKND